MSILKSDIKKQRNMKKSKTENMARTHAQINDFARVSCDDHLQHKNALKVRQNIQHSYIIRIK